MSWLFGSCRPAITLQTDRPVRAAKKLPTQPATPPTPKSSAAQRPAEGGNPNASDLEVGDGLPHRVVSMSEPECTCDLIDVSTRTEILFVRGFSRGCVVHPPTEYEVRLIAAERERRARVEAAMKQAREA